LTGPPAPIPTAAPPLRTRARLTRRDAGFGFATAGYRASFDGALAEISYYWTQDQARFVLKGELESVRPTSALFQETGSLFLPDRRLVGARRHRGSKAAIHTHEKANGWCEADAIPYIEKAYADLAEQAFQAGGG
jgi:hypothetical protein